MKNNKKIILITGASSGIGKACAEYLHKKGYHVFGTSRKPKNSNNNSFELIEMDIADYESVKKGIKYIIDKTGRIDILINNAGYGISGAIEDTSIIKVKEQFETNFFGIHRISKEILPLMRKQKDGYIINISSIGGIIGLPFQGLYCASKFALEGWTESLRMEVNSFGIKVVLIEPGDIKTSFTHKREKITSYLKKSFYKEKTIKALNVVEKDEQGGPSPDKVAYLLERIINKKSPKLRYKVGSFSQILICYLKRIIPDRSIQWILMKYYKID
jgi:short-subunit dehydrogenase